MDRITWLKGNCPSVVSLYEASLAAYAAHRSFDGNFSDPSIVEEDDRLRAVQCAAFKRFVDALREANVFPPEDLLEACDVCPGKRFFWEGPEDNCDGGMRGVCLDCGHWCVH